MKLILDKSDISINKKIIIILILIFSFFLISVLASKFIYSNKSFIKINFDESLSNKNENLIFIVPKKFNPDITNNKKMFRIRFDYKTRVPVHGGSITEGDVVSVLVCYSEDGFMRSESAIDKVQEFDGGIGNVPYLVGNYNGMDIYEYDFGSQSITLGRMYVYRDSNENIVVVDGGPESYSVYRVYRKYNNNIELDYSFGKEHGPGDFEEIDASVIQVISSFQKSN